MTLVRGTQTGRIQFSISQSGPATTRLTPGESQAAGAGDGTTVSIDVPPDAPGGIYPLLIGASDGSITRHAAAVLVVDAEAPETAVTGLGFAPAGTVSTAGIVALQVAWMARDQGSGLAGAQLRHSPNGTNWTVVPGGPGSATPFSAGAGPHIFQVQASDAVGNSATSASSGWTLTEAQQTAATYSGSWSTFSAPAAWGTTRYSKTRGASATFTFNGTDVVWVAQRGPRRGKAKVYLDGKLTRVDLYASSLTERRVVFSAAKLAAGQHTLKIVVNGTTGRPRVDVDGFLVLAP